MNRPARALTIAILTVLVLRSATHTDGTPTRLSPSPVGPGLFDVAGLRLQAAADVVRLYAPYSSRYSVRIVNVPAGAEHWEVRDPGDAHWNWPGEAGGGLSNNAAKPYGTAQKAATIDCDLREYETIDESVTFHDLTFTHGPFADLRFANITTAQSATTPSGITVTIPRQSVATFEPGGEFDYNGPGGVAFLQFQITPAKARNVLAASPLYRKYHIPVSITLAPAAPVAMNSNSIDPANPTLRMTFPDHKALHVDSLTVTVEQRVDLRDIPLALTVPIVRS